MAVDVVPVSVAVTAVVLDRVVVTLVAVTLVAVVTEVSVAVMLVSVRVGSNLFLVQAAPSPPPACFHVLNMCMTEPVHTRQNHGWQS